MSNFPESAALARYLSNNLPNGYKVSSVFSNNKKIRVSKNPILFVEARLNKDANLISYNNPWIAFVIVQLIAFFPLALITLMFKKKYDACEQVTRECIGKYLSETASDAINK